MKNASGNRSSSSRWHASSSNDWYRWRKQRSYGVWAALHRLREGHTDSVVFINSSTQINGVSDLYSGYALYVDYSSRSYGEEPLRAETAQRAERIISNNAKGMCVIVPLESSVTWWMKKSEAFSLEFLKIPDYENRKELCAESSILPGSYRHYL